MQGSVNVVVPTVSAGNAIRDDCVILNSIGRHWLPMSDRNLGLRERQACGFILSWTKFDHVESRPFQVCFSLSWSHAQAETYGNPLNVSSSGRAGRNVGFPRLSGLPPVVLLHALLANDQIVSVCEAKSTVRAGVTMDGSNRPWRLRSKYAGAENRERQDELSATKHTASLPGRDFILFRRAHIIAKRWIPTKPTSWP